MRKFYTTPTSDMAKKWEQLFLHYHKRLYNIALYMTNNKHDAEDALQATFVKLSQHLEKIEDIASDRTYDYIVKALRNSVKDLWRKKNAQSESVYNDEFSSDYIDSYGKTAEDVAIEEIEFEKIVCYISRLDDIYKIPLTLKYYHGLSIKEIAEFLDEPPGPIPMRIYRAKQKILEMDAREKEGNSI